MATFRWAAVVLALTCLGGCSRKKPEINGIGSWVLLESQLRQAPGFCNPDEITFCSGNGAVPLGGQPADVGLYFRGPEPTSPLIEITLSVRRCKDNKVIDAMVEALGAPNVRKGNHFLWRGKLAVVAAELPASGRRCEVSFVTATDKERVAALTAAAQN